MSASMADLPFKPSLARAERRRAVRAVQTVGVAMLQSAAFAAVLWLVVAAPGFLG